MKCTNPSCRMYGKEITPGAKFCGVCGQIVKEEDKVPDSAYYSEGSGSSSGGGRKSSAGSRSGGGFRGVNRMPQGIALGVGERVVKQYKIGRYTMRAGAIEVIVTNKRVIRYEESSFFGMQNNAIDEINIDSVHGIHTYMRRSISILGLIFSTILFILGLAALLSSGVFGSKMINYLVGFAAWGATAAIIISSLKPSLIFGISGPVGHNALLTKVNHRGRLFRNDDNSIIFQFKPTSETTVMLKEIGACIYDLKTLGDDAIEKWS